MTDTSHILIVDDDRRIRALLGSFLTSHGFRTTGASSAHEARNHMRGLSFDLLILDVMMPGENGVSFASDLRQTGNATPILMLSARTDAADRIKGLSAGSDDYLGKPFEPEELLLRVRNLLRRSTPAVVLPVGVAFGNCLFLFESGELTRDGERVHLTSKEKEMLRLLAGKAGAAVTRSALGSDGSARGVDVQINRLRRKIEDDPANPVYLQTVRGEGYALLGATPARAS